MDANPAYDYVVEGNGDPTRGVADLDDAQLGSFLSRPILIKEFSWQQGLSFFETFDPWSEFFNNPRNINRISNFNLMRSRLCVKFLVNGNGFYYGRLVASYNPLPGTDQVTVNRGLNIKQDVIGASQRPHIYINPTECQGGSLCVPFFHYQNALKVPEAQWSEMGAMTLQTLNTLRNCNGAATVDSFVTVSVFAWAENVDLSVPTSQNPSTITPQSDEYGVTPVSAVASTVARVAGALTTAPVIGPFAKATQIAAKGVGSVASLFGMSRPAVIDPIQIYKPEYVGGLANTNVPDGTNKLSLDVKQEVTVDPTVTGVGSADEMTLKSVAMRESYYTTFAWDQTGGVKSGPGYKLFQTQVMPTVYQTFGSGQNMEYHNVPAGMAALPFKYWGGSMEFRFQIVSSNFHRGRIRVAWDPCNLDGGTNSTDYNTMYTKVVDIADMRDFTFKVGWGREYSFLPVQNPMQLYDGLPLPTFADGPTAPAVLQQVLGNGTLSVFIVNDLTVPNSDPAIDASVEVNVFVSMCDDIRLAEPTDNALRSITYFVPTATVTPQSDEGTALVQESAPVSTDVSVAVGAVGATSDHTMDVFFGEEITSIRQLLKRYNLHSATSTGTLANESEGFTMKLKMPDFPYYNGYNPEGPAVSVNGNFAYSHMTMLNYFTPAYAAYRGGLRWKHFATRAPTNLGQTFSRQDVMSDVNMTVERGDGSEVVLTSTGLYEPYSYSTQSSVFRPLSGPTTVSAEQCASVLTNYHSMIDGAFTSPLHLNPSLEVEMPYYTNRRFYAARRIRNLDNRGRFFDENPGIHELTVTGMKSTILSYVSVAEDFSLAFFVGVPIMYSLGGGGPNPVPDVFFPV